VYKFCISKTYATFAPKFINSIKPTKTKQMKKLTQSVLAILVVASSITACKKGEDDPFLSLRSRDARLMGEWKLTAIAGKTTATSSGTETNLLGTSTVTENLTIDENYNGTVLETKVTYSIAVSPGSTETESTTSRSNVTLELTINDDGTAVVTTSSTPVSVTTVRVPALPRPTGFSSGPDFNSALGYGWTSSEWDETYNYTSSTSKDTYTGYWNWENTNKNKTRVVIDGLGTFNVRQLKNKELILEVVEMSSSNFTTTGESENSTSDDNTTWTFEAK
jgi:hypothetical protein